MSQEKDVLDRVFDCLDAVRQRVRKVAEFIGKMVWHIFLVIQCLLVFGVMAGIMCMLMWFIILVWYS